MDEKTTDLARQLVDANLFRWMAGMRAYVGPGLPVRLISGDEPVHVPDLDDPATAGCLLALLEESAPGRGGVPDRERITLSLFDDGEWEYALPSDLCACGYSLGSALACALIEISKEETSD